jgi:hypothetical protein
MDDQRQVGLTPNSAALWYGTAASYVSLHPPGMVRSGALGVRGNMQVGGVAPTWEGGFPVVWRGTPESMVNLHPATSVRNSTARATDGILQGGMSEHYSGPWIVQQAAIWNGTAASHINISPGGAPSVVHAMASGVQVGELQGIVRAALWRGTAESWTDMHPPGQSGASILYGTTGRVHVGRFGIVGFARAAINFGAPDAWLDLHQFLPANYGTFSAARGVHQEGDIIYVGGYAVNSATTYNEAILWIGTDPCYANCDGSTTPPILNVDDFSCFIQRFAAREGYANCDRSTTPPVLNVEDFSCFINAFARGCP